MTAANNTERNNALGEALRELGKSSTPRELAQRGVRRVRSVPMDQVWLVIEKAVEKAIRERTPETNAGDMSGLLEHAQAGVVELLQGVHQVEQSRGTIRAQRQELQGELAEMRRDRELSEPTSAAEAIAERDRQIERLERRIAKLVTSLEETEEVLKRVSAMKNYEFGVASIYRMVQGLSDSDANADAKRDMMSRIFQANVALQSKRSEESP